MSSTPNKQKAQFDFRRASKILFLIAAIVGLFLSRHAGTCFMDAVASFELAGVVDDGTNTALVGDDGIVKKGIKGDYAENVNKGSGFFAYLYGSGEVCIANSSFHDPRFAMYGFWALLGLGLVCAVLEKLITPNWKKDLRKTGKKIDEKKRRERGEDPDDMPVRRPPTPKKEIKPIELDIPPMDVSGGDSGGGGLSLTSNHDLAAVSEPSAPSYSTSSIEVPSLSSSELDSDSLVRTSHSRLKVAAHEEPLPEIGGGGDEDDPFGFEDDNPFELGSSHQNLEAIPQDNASRVSKSRLSGVPSDVLSARPELGELGLGSMDDLGGADWSLDDDYARDNSLGHGAIPLSSDQALSLDSTFNELSEFTNSESSRFVDFGEEDGDLSLDGGLADDPFGFSEASPSGSVAALPRSAWSPPWKGPILYVAPMLDRGDGLASGNNPSEPIYGLADAVAEAQNLVNEGHKVQLRLLPGTYYESVVLPPQVALVNHNMPSGDSPEDEEALRDWLYVNDENTDVILAGSDRLGPEDYILDLNGSHDSWVVGIRFVGPLLEGDDPRRIGGAVSVHDADNARFYVCSFVGFLSSGDGGAMHIRNCGDVEQKLSVQIERCLFEGNQADGCGGAIYSEDAIVVLRESTLCDNFSAVAGGALYAQDSPIPLLLEDTIICDNSVEIDDELPDASKSGWSGEVGHGGGIYVAHSGMHLRRCDILSNKAVGAGGGIFAFASRLMFEGNEKEDDRPIGQFADNQALRGGAVLLSGLKPEGDDDRMTAIRATRIDFSKNQADESGGAIATFRMVALDINDCLFERNIVSADYGEGGAIHATVGSRLKLTNTEILNNRAPLRGGGLSVCNSSMRIFDGCSIAENQSGRGEFAGVAFYTTSSRLFDDLKSSEQLEVPVVCAISPCSITHNRSRRGVGGLFIGCLDREPAVPVVYAIKAPELITDNVVASVVAKRKAGNKPSKKRPENLMIIWGKKLVATESRPPVGKQSLSVATPTANLVEQRQ